MEIHFPHVLGTVWISALPKIFKKPINLKCLCFPILFPYYGNPLFPCFEFWRLYGFLLLAKYVKKHLTLEYSAFSYLSGTTRHHFHHVLGTMLLMWRLINIFYFWSHFHTNVYVKRFTKEANLFCSWAQPNICILDPFDIKAWKYIKYRRVGSVFYGSDSIAIFLWIWQLEFV